MKKIYLIHEGGGSSENEWFNWLKKELTKKGIKVFSFDMPNTNNPKIDEWVKYLEQKIPFNSIDNETYFLGHSIGCQTIMRFLDKFPKEKEIAGCVFVAGWFNLKEDSYESKEEKEIACPWITNKIDFDRIKRHTNNFLAIFSDNDPFVPLTDAKLFKERLGAKIIFKKAGGHFDTLEEFSEVGNEVLKFIK